MMWNVMQEGAAQSLKQIAFGLVNLLDSGSGKSAATILKYNNFALAEGVAACAHATWSNRFILVSLPKAYVSCVNMSTKTCPLQA